MKPKKFQTEIKQVQNLTKDTINLVLKTPKDFEFIPGQYVSIISESNNKKIIRPYSIASQQNQDLELCIKIVKNGIFTSTLKNLKPKDTINLLGPLGHFKIQPENPAVFISNGTGVAPFKSAINHLLKNNFKKQIILIAGYRYENEILYDKEFKELQLKHANFIYLPIISRPSKNFKGHKGRVQTLLKNHLNPETEFYICGLKEMVNEVKTLLEKNNIQKENIHFEKYD